MCIRDSWKPTVKLTFKLMYVKYCYVWSERLRADRICIRLISICFTYEGNKWLIFSLVRSTVRWAFQASLWLPTQKILLLSTRRVENFLLWIMYYKISVMFVRLFPYNNYILDSTKLTMIRAGVKKDGCEVQFHLYYVIELDFILFHKMCTYSIFH